MNLKAMHQAAARKRRFTDGYLVPNHLLVDMVRPVGLKRAVTYADVMSFTRASGMARPVVGDAKIENTNVLTIDADVYRALFNKPDLLDVLRQPK